MDPKIQKILSSYAEPLIRELLARYYEGNEAARIFPQAAGEEGWDIFIDHITIRCHHVDKRAQEFLKIGYAYRDERIEYPDQGWWAKVYRKDGYPALFIDQAYEDERGRSSILPEWVNVFGDQVLHHIAVRVGEIEGAVAALSARQVSFAGGISGNPGTRLRQIFTAAEVRREKAFSVLELIERNQYDGFVPEQADSLMQSSTTKRPS